MNDPIKAKRVLIQHGEFELEVFQMPGGEYRLSQSQILERIDEDPAWISRLTKKAPKNLKALQDKGFRGCLIPVKIEGEAKARQAKTLSIEDAGHVWGWFAINGNAKALAMLVASNTESIERRADAAFGVIRSEAERNERHKVREDGKVIRRQLTDAIADFMKRHSENLSDNDKRWMYKNCSDRANKLAIGRIAKKAAAELGCEHALLRDFLQTNELVRLTSLEDLTVRLIDLHDIHPLEAVKQAAERLLF
jgi:hypothetical protein